MTAELAVNALTNACRNQGYPKNVLLHSDQGSKLSEAQYIHIRTIHSDCQPFEYAALLLRKRLSLRYCSYGVFLLSSAQRAILKKEEVYLNSYIDFDSAKLQLFDFIEGFYNRSRIHSSIEFKTPIEFEYICLDS